MVDWLMVPLSGTIVSVGEVSVKINSHLKTFSIIEQHTRNKMVEGINNTAGIR